MSEEALSALFSTDTSKTLITLITIYDPTNSNTVLYRICNRPIARVEETPTTVLYGCTQNNTIYYFLPMEITLPGESESQAPRCTISIKDATQTLIPLIRQTNTPPKIRLDLCLSSANTVQQAGDTVGFPEATFSGLYMSGINYTASTVTIELAMTDYAREPFPMHSMTPAYFPGIF